MRIDDSTTLPQLDSERLFAYRSVLASPGLFPARTGQIDISFSSVGEVLSEGCCILCAKRSAAWHTRSRRRRNTNRPSEKDRCQTHAGILIVELLLVVFSSAQQRWPWVQAFLFFFVLRPCVNVRTRVHMMCSRGQGSADRVELFNDRNS